MAQPWYDWLNPVHDFESLTQLWGKETNAIVGWFAGLGGQLASGLEAAFIAFFGDIWHVIGGFFYIGIGLAILAVTAFFVFGGHNAAGAAALAAAAVK